MPRCTILLLCLILITSLGCKESGDVKKEGEAEASFYTEPFRPQYHYSPPEKWMNDPNGLVYYKGIYHLFYQYYPDDIVWGPMHWGHATSTDMLHWDNQPIALYPDKNGLIFSGSAVIDHDNNSGLGTADNPPLVAVFTYHDMEKEKAGGTDFQTQGVAYSLDNGESFEMYEGNPVIPNTEFRDFRDPKVFWDEGSGKWVMALVAGDHLQLYRSDNLLDWTYMSRFGADQGAHGGVWECPDLFELAVAGTDESRWVLLISINPGAPNGGSGTQYFIGDFDGTSFTSDQEEARWLDWGTDNYAGVTYNNVPDDDRIFIGWMSNWTYARDTPTEVWRSAMTLPRKLSLVKINEEYTLLNYPISGIEELLNEQSSLNVEIPPNTTETIVLENGNQSAIHFVSPLTDLSLSFKNEAGEELLLELDSEEGLLVLDRSKSGIVDFQEMFANIQQMPLDNLPEGDLEFDIFLDASSVEVFVNKGQFVMTSQLFPTRNFDELVISNDGNKASLVPELRTYSVKRIWRSGD